MWVILEALCLFLCDFCVLFGVGLVSQAPRSGLPTVLVGLAFMLLAALFWALHKIIEEVFF